MPGATGIASQRNEVVMTSAVQPSAILPQPDRSESGRDPSTPEVRRLSSLLAITQALSGTLKLKSAMHHVLEILARHHSAVRGVITLIQEDGGLGVEAKEGL